MLPARLVTSQPYPCSRCFSGSASCSAPGPRTTGINVWTHGELLPAHGYPALKKRFPHLVGNYGGAWYAQQKEFAEFPGERSGALFLPRVVGLLQGGFAAAWTGRGA